MSQQPRGCVRLPPKSSEQQAEVGHANSAIRAELVPPASEGELERTGLCWGGWGPPQITTVIVILEYIHREPPGSQRAVHFRRL